MGVNLCVCRWSEIARAPKVEGEPLLSETVRRRAPKRDATCTWGRRFTMLASRLDLA